MLQGQLFELDNSLPEVPLGFSIVIEQIDSFFDLSRRHVCCILAMGTILGGGIMKSYRLQILKSLSNPTKRSSPIHEVKLLVDIYSQEEESDLRRRRTRQFKEALQGVGMLKSKAVRTVRDVFSLAKELSASSKPGQVDRLRVTLIMSAGCRSPYALTGEQQAQLLLTTLATTRVAEFVQTPPNEYSQHYVITVCVFKDLGLNLLWQSQQPR